MTTPNNENGGAKARPGLLFWYKTVDVIDHAATGESYRRLRKSFGVSLRALAKQLKVSAPFLSDLERGRRNWDQKWALAYNKAAANAKIAAIQSAVKSAHKVNLKLD
jgi:DNA-binding XRE family transcriptional regulator